MYFRATTYRCSASLHGCADVQTIAAALIAVINSLPGRGEHIQLYRAVQDVQSAVDACVDKYTLRNSEGDPVAHKGSKPAQHMFARKH